MPLITRNSQNANVKLGTTAQLAAITFTDGDLASDTTLNKVKVFNGVSLTEIGSTSFSSSAVVSQSTTIGDYTTPSNSFVSSPAPTLEYLVIAGGGGTGTGGAPSGNRTGGGGGAGGYRTASGHTVTIQTYSITVGAGGAAGTEATIGGNGGNSIFDSITSTGGGGGGYADGGGGGAGANGGSGGGGGSHSNAGGSGNTPSTSPSQGNNGGVGGANPESGGGGGSSSAGSGITGGAGTSSSITGSAVTRATGGTSAANVNGGNNTGDGAGSQTIYSGTGKTGGSGIVILRYQTGTVTATGGTMTTDGSFTIHSFTSSGSFVVSALGAGLLAIDNNTATKWTSSSESNPNIYVDMGSALNLCAAAFYFNSTDTTNTEILIQSSADASTWTTRRTITESNLSDGAYNYYRFNIAGGARYIRFYGNSAGSTVLSIWEIKILKKTDAEIFNDLGILTITASDTALGPDGT